MKDVYEVYGRIDGKPAGFVGRYQTKEKAAAAARRSQVSCIVRRERISAEEYHQWEDSGYKPRGWIGK